MLFLLVGTLTASPVFLLQGRIMLPISAINKNLTMQNGKLFQAVHSVTYSSLKVKRFFFIQLYSLLWQIFIVVPRPLVGEHCWLLQVHQKGVGLRTTNTCILKQQNFYSNGKIILFWYSVKNVAHPTPVAVVYYKLFVYLLL